MSLRSLYPGLMSLAPEIGICENELCVVQGSDVIGTCVFGTPLATVGISSCRAAGNKIGNY